MTRRGRSREASTWSRLGRWRAVVVAAAPLIAWACTSPGSGGDPSGGSPSGAGGSAGGDPAPNPPPDGLLDDGGTPPPPTTVCNPASMGPPPAVTLNPDWGCAAPGQTPDPNAGVGAEDQRIPFGPGVVNACSRGFTLTLGPLLGLERDGDLVWGSLRPSSPSDAVLGAHWGISWMHVLTASADASRLSIQWGSGEVTRFRRLASGRYKSTEIGSTDLFVDAAGGNYVADTGGVKLKFEPAGASWRATEIKDTFGVATTIHYDATLGLPDLVTLGNGVTEHYVYGGGVITEIDYAPGSYKLLVTVSGGDLQKVTAPHGPMGVAIESSFEYQGHLLTRVRNGASTPVFKFDYAGDGRIDRSSDLAQTLAIVENAALVDGSPPTAQNKSYTVTSSPDAIATTLQLRNGVLVQGDGPTGEEVATDVTSPLAGWVEKDGVREQLTWSNDPEPVVTAVTDVDTCRTTSILARNDRGYPTSVRLPNGSLETFDYADVTAFPWAPPGLVVKNTMTDASGGATETCTLALSDPSPGVHHLQRSCGATKASSAGVDLDAEGEVIATYDAHGRKTTITPRAGALKFLPETVTYWFGAQEKEVYTDDGTSVGYVDVHGDSLVDVTLADDDEPATDKSLATGETDDLEAPTSKGCATKSVVHFAGSGHQAEVDVTPDDVCSPTKIDFQSTEGEVVEFMRNPSGEWNNLAGVQ